MESTVLRKRVLFHMLLLVIFLSLGMFQARTSEAATYYVPDNFTTIQLAIDAAASGDTIMVSPGTYYENIQITNKAVTLQSTDGPQSTIIDGQQLGVVVYIYGASANGVLNGFTIRNGLGEPGSIWPAEKLITALLPETQGRLMPAESIYLIHLFLSAYPTVLYPKMSDNMAVGSTTTVRLE